MKTRKQFQRITVGLLAALVLVLPAVNALAANTSLNTSSTVLEPLSASQSQQLRWGSIVKPSPLGCTAYDVSDTGATTTDPCAVPSAPEDQNGTFVSSTGAQNGSLLVNGDVGASVTAVFAVSSCTTLAGVTLTRLSPGGVAGGTVTATLAGGAFTWAISGTIEVLGSASTGVFNCLQTVDVNY